MDWVACPFNNECNKQGMSTCIKHEYMHCLTDTGCFFVCLHGISTEYLQMV